MSCLENFSFLCESGNIFKFNRNTHSNNSINTFLNLFASSLHYHIQMFFLFLIVIVDLNRKKNPWKWTKMMSSLKIQSVFKSINMISIRKWSTWIRNENVSLKKPLSLYVDSHTDSVVRTCDTCVKSIFFLTSPVFRTQYRWFFDEKF